MPSLCSLLAGVALTTFSLLQTSSALPTACGSTTPTSTIIAPNCNRDNCLRQFIQNTAAVSSFCATYTATATALPTFVSQCGGLPSRVSSACSCVVTPTAISTPEAQPDPTLPVNGGPIELAAPPADHKLLYVTIGRGVQNYTCAAAGATPSLIGAVANLYDATALARNAPSHLHTLPLALLSLPTPTGTTPLSGLPFLGLHFFDSLKTPVFTLTGAPTATKPIIYIQRALGDTSIPAPKPNGISAGVDWLNLEVKTSEAYLGLTVGLKQVYRVVTAGGLGGVCEGVGEKSVQYATEYWFYN